MNSRGGRRPTPVERVKRAIKLRADGLEWREVATRAGFPSPDAARVAVAAFNRSVNGRASETEENSARAEENSPVSVPETIPEAPGPIQPADPSPEPSEPPIARPRKVAFYDGDLP